MCRMGCGASEVQPQGEPPRVTADWNPGAGDRPFTLGQTKPAAIMRHAETQATMQDLQDQSAQVDYPSSYLSDDDMDETMSCAEECWWPQRMHRVEEIVTTTHLHLKDIGIIDAAVQTLRQYDYSSNKKIQTLLHRHERTEIEPFISNRTEETDPVRRLSDDVTSALDEVVEDKENSCNKEADVDALDKLPGSEIIGQKWTASEEDLSKWVTSDFKGQTEPISRAPAANALGMTEDELHFIQQELDHAHDSMSQSSAQDSLNGSGVKSPGRHPDEDCLEKTVACGSSRAGTLSSMSNPLATIIEKREIAVQTLNDVTTDESAEFAARPPPCKKKELIPIAGIFNDVDKIVCQVPAEIEEGGIENLVNYLMSKCRSDLFKVRAIFRWITNNVSFDWKFIDEKLEPEEVLRTKKGVCKDYCSLFCEMCKHAGIRVKQIQGFAKGHDYRPGHQFSPGADVPHAWNAVFLFGCWRLIDVTWGTGFTDHTGVFQRKLNEHFFLTDPEVFIWTHFPFDDLEAHYERWQLLDAPMSLETFNSLPKVTPHFFQFSMKIRSKVQNPLEFRVRTDIRIASHDHMRFKFKLYPAEEVENSTLNNYVFCHLVEDRLVSCFGITPPTEGRYYFKVYARPERDMGKDDASLQNVAIFLLNCTRARKYLIPYPSNEVPWGPTQTFYDYNMKLVNQNGPVIVSWGGKRKLQIDLNEAMLITHQVLDADGQEIDTTGMLSREDKDKRITFVLTPVRVGYFKLIIFGMPKPKQKGKWRLPLIATFLIDCKLTSDRDRRRKQSTAEILASPTTPITAG